MPEKCEYASKQLGIGKSGEVGSISKFSRSFVLISLVGATLQIRAAEKDAIMMF